MSDPTSVSSDPPPRDPYRIGYPQELEARETQMWQLRKDAHTDAKPCVGFGLSGGGIRSATFCLGLFQALAKKNRLSKIDFLSSVSGGGYFASFYGRLFTRADINGFDDINKILSPDRKAQLDLTRPGETAVSWKSDIFRWLRENGRYLAPNGSGDLLIGIAVFLRNWMTVQLTVGITILAIFLAAQLLRTFLGEFSLTQNNYLWPDPYFYVVGFVGIFGAFPLGWAYWAFGLPEPDGSSNQAPLPHESRFGMLPRITLQGLRAMLALAILLAAIAEIAIHLDPALSPRATSASIVVLDLTFLWWQLALVRTKVLSGALIAFAITLAVAIAAIMKAINGGTPYDLRVFVLLPFIAGALCCITFRKDSFEAINQSEAARSLLSQWFRTGLFVTLGILAFAVVDSASQTLYALSFTPRFTPHRWLIPFFTAVAAVVSFGQSIWAATPKRKEASVSLSLATVAGIGAVIVIAPALVALGAVSYGIAYGFSRPLDAPCSIMNVADQSQKAGSGAARTCGAVFEPPSLKDSASAALSVITRLGDASAHPYATFKRAIANCGSGRRNRRCIASFLVLAAFFSVVVGAASSRSSWELLNRTSLHPLYTARLIRAYLGASNKSRHGSTAPGVSDPVNGDDLPQEEYWRPGETFWRKGAPLHLVNVTINETLDGRTQTEQRDRKGVGMAVGPGGFSVGVQHHVVFTEQTRGKRGTKFLPVRIFPGPSEFAVFGYKEERDKFYGRPLSLGNWVGISGAAVSTGLGKLGSLGTSLLTGFFNLRLGYWWDSGTRSITPGDKKLGGGARFSSVLGKWMAWLMPVQSSLLDEFLGRFHGTLRRYWYLTDGGHFENLAGYELIRRRLPIMIIVDAAGDPEYSFSDLANLIQKARQDFNADITFVDPSSTDCLKKKELDAALKSIEECFAPVTREVLGRIDQLRRGRWASEPVPERRAFFRSVNESLLSLRHSALAKVTYLDNANMVSYLLLIKPTLIGEEPQDLLNYHSAHPAFPHESTAEQFFNEAQWESYRRLGQHIGERLFS